MGGWSAEALVRPRAEAGDAPAIIDAAGPARGPGWIDDAMRWRPRFAGRGGAGSRGRGAAEPSMDAIAAVLGVLRAGASWRRSHGPGDTGAGDGAGRPGAGARPARLALVSGSRAPGIAGWRSSRPSFPAHRRLRPRLADFDPEAPAVIVLTSGTTGRPKGVVLSGRAMAASAESWLAALPPATGWMLALGLGHVAGLGILWRAIARASRCGSSAVRSGRTPGRARRRAADEPCLAGPGAARPPAGRRRRCPAPDVRACGASRRRPDPARARHPRASRRLARGPDLRSLGDRLRRHGPGDRRGVRAPGSRRSAAPGCPIADRGPDADGRGGDRRGDRRAVQRLPGRGGTRCAGRGPCPHRRPRPPRPRRRPVRQSTAASTASCAAARTSPRRRWSPSCSRTPPSRMPSSSGGRTRSGATSRRRRSSSRRASQTPATRSWPPTPARPSPGSRSRCRSCAWTPCRARPAASSAGRPSARSSRGADRGACPPRRRLDRLAGDRDRGRSRCCSCTGRSRTPGSWTGSP